MERIIDSLNQLEQVGCSCDDCTCDERLDYLIDLVISLAIKLKEKEIEK